MTKPIAIVGAVLIGLGTQALAAPPKAVADDLSHLRVQHLFTTVQTLLAADP